MKSTMRFQTAGGAVVTWTHTPEARCSSSTKLNHFGTWRCAGCGVGATVQDYGKANDHARICRAMP